MLNRNITGMHGIGALSFAHTDEQIEYITKTIKEIAPLVFQTDMGKN